jgi:hypothetical protein
VLAEAGTGAPRRLRRLAWALPLVAAAACQKLDPAAELAVGDIETYWAIDPSMHGTSYVAPVVRFQVINKGTQRLRSVEARARFWRKETPPVDWGGGGAFVATWRKPLLPGKSVPLVLKSDGRYTSSGPPEEMLKNPDFRDARAEIFLRIGASRWAKVADVDIERRIGSRSVEAH